MILLINKPPDWTSFDVVGLIRKKARQQTGVKNIKVGHAGTLDPFATGLLIVAVGRADTKRLDEFKGLPKTYVATVHFGATSTTGDPTGEVTELEQTTRISPYEKDEVETVLKAFLGKQEQIPPMHSAKSIGGVRLYKLARQGKTIDRLPESIEIFSLNLADYKWPRAVVKVTCSPGTYIRTLAEDIGKKLGTGAYCEALERTAIGSFKLSEATDVKNIDEALQNFVP